MAVIEIIYLSLGNNVDIFKELTTVICLFFKLVSEFFLSDLQNGFNLIQVQGHLFIDLYIKNSPNYKLVASKLKPNYRLVDSKLKPNYRLVASKLKLNYRLVASKLKPNYRLVD
jgi:hypothetical protein